MNSKHYLSAATQSMLTTSLIVALVAALFFTIEPKISRAVDSGPFTIKQTITDEISFLVDAANVSMVGPLQGITGGTANGSTTVVVQTNNAQGYTMTIAFFDNGTPQTMLGDVSLSEAIRDYPATSSQPTFLFSTASTSSVFAYTVSANDSSDLDPSFLDNGSACNTGSGFTTERCWMEPQTSAFQIIDRDVDAGTGATTTIHFRVYVPNNPTPAVTEDVYTATATLTALNQ